MVSLNTILVIGALIVGAVTVIGLGGPSGVGKKIGGAIGGGLSQFSSSLTSAFTGGLFGGSTNPNTGGAGGTGGSSGGAFGIPPATQTGAFDPFGNLLGNFTGLQNILNTLNNLFTLQGPAFQVGGQGGPTFATALFPVITKSSPGVPGGTKFGGFINKQTQQNALEALLAENKLKFPGFF